MEITVNQVQIRLNPILIQYVIADAIVNDTDSSLTLPDWMIEDGGESLVQAAHMLGWCDIGNAVITPAGNLNASYVIHAVGPKWGDDSARGKLANATWNTLRVADDNTVLRLAIPPIATGANGYPVENCAKIMLREIVDFTYELPSYLRHILICTQTDEETAAFTLQMKHFLANQNTEGDASVG